MEKILVSACLLGAPVRYNGTHAFVEDSVLATWQREGRLVAFCPEQYGGLPTPRPAAEIVGGDGHAVLRRTARVVDQHHQDFTEAFVRGAQGALRLCQQQGIKGAVLKADSPSCGSHSIYDGQFAGNKTPGVGVTTALLQQHGIRVFHEHEIEAAVAWLQTQAHHNENASSNGALSKQSLRQR